MGETQDIKKKIVQAALDCAAEMRWDACSFIDISERSGCDLAVLYGLFDSKDDILVAYGRQVDVQVAGNVGAFRAGDDCRDRLFDVLMERFEILNENRAALLSILASFEGDPKQAVVGLPYIGKSMVEMLTLAGMESGGIRGAIRVAGLAGLYLKTLHVWKYDDSADMAKVMAVLDKDLRRAEQVMNFLSV
jgi:AcrR family transcriptional regulator